MPWENKVWSNQAHRKKTKIFKIATYPHESYKSFNQIHNINQRFIIEPMNTKPSATHHINDGGIYINEAEISAADICELGDTNRGSRITSIRERTTIIMHELKILDCHEDKQRAVEGFCRKRCYLFYIPGDKLSYTNVLKHNIKLKSEVRPIYTKQYRIPQAHKKKLSELIQEYEN